MINRVVILNDVSTARGGATGLALASARELRAREIAVTFITGDAGDNAELAGLGVQTVSLAQSVLLDAGIGEAFFRGLYNPKTVATVGDWIARHDTPGTIYHIHTWAKILSPSLFRALRPVARRLVISAHDFFLVCPNGGYVLYKTGSVCDLRPMSLACAIKNCDRRSYGHKVWRLARQAARSALFDLGRESPTVLALHDGMIAGLVRGGVPRAAIRVLRNPVRAFSDARIKAESNREAIFIGRLHEEKGPDIAAMAARAAGIALRIVGDGPMYASLKSAYPEVSFEGSLPHEDIGRFARSARALLMPSRYPEPFGLVAGEALWSGLPVVLGDTAMLAENIVARGAGIACDLRRTDSLADALRMLFADDASTMRMSHNAFNNTRDLANTLDQWMSALISTYEDVIETQKVLA